MKIGDRIYIEGEEYIIALATSNAILFINLEDGTRWDDPVFVKDSRRIKRKKITEIVGDAEWWRK